MNKRILGMTIKKVLSILRNDICVDHDIRKEAYLMAADLIEEHIREKEYWRIRQHKRVY